MLDNLCIEIENCNTEHFDKDNNVWCVDCYWTETDINKNKGNDIPVYPAIKSI